MRVAAAIILCTLAACASVNDTLTPSAKILHDKFDDATIIRQDPVSAAGTLSDGWHTLGFEWNSKTPNDIYLDAGTNGIVPITSVEFKADGKVLTPPAIASSYSESEHGWSVRRFVMPLQDFLSIARGKDVKMRLGQGNNSTVSEFGSDHPLAIVNKKFKPFTDKVLELSKGI